MSPHQTNLSFFVAEAAHTFVFGKRISNLLKLLSFIWLVFPCNSASAQNISNYTFSTGNQGSLSSDLSGNVVDMTSGTLLLVGPSQKGGTGPIGNVKIGFDFWAMGGRSNDFQVSSSGWLGVGTPVSGSNQWLSLGSPGHPKLVPFGARRSTNGEYAMATSSAGKIHSKVFGQYPNRTLVVEYLNMMVNYNVHSATTYDSADATFQVRLYEASGVIEYVYGKMKVSGTTDVFADIGFFNSSNEFHSINTTTHTTSTTTSMAMRYTRGVIADLSSNADGSRRFYRYTPIQIPSLAGISFSEVTMTSMKLSWNDVANDIGYAIYRSDNGGSSWSFHSKTPHDSTNYTAKFLASGTNYLWRVASLRETVSDFQSGLQATSNGSLSGVLTIGLGGTYPNLTTAFADINAKGLNGDLHLQLIAGYPATAETYPITSSNTVTGNYKLFVYPTVSGLSVTSSNENATFNFTNARNLIIDGRVNATGSTADLLIQNTSVSGAAIRFQSGAVFNTLNYCKIKGSNSSLTSGVIVFSNWYLLTGNNNNVISNCEVSDAITTPTNLVYSAGHYDNKEFYNRDNLITGNRFFNYLCNPANITSNSGTGVYLSSGNTEWTISNNSFYHTVNRSGFISGPITAVVLSNRWGSFTVINNFIGGTQPLAAGPPFRLETGTSGFFQAIKADVADVKATVISGNVYRNVICTNDGNANNTSDLFAVFMLNAGTFDVNNNTIGSSLAGNGFNYSSSGTSTLTSLSGFKANPSTRGSISDNEIKGVSVNKTSTGSVSFRGLDVTSAYDLLIEGNVIGSLTMINSIVNATNNSTVGILAPSASSLGNFIQRNTIANITALDTNTNTSITGIHIPFGSVRTISSNSILQLKNNGRGRTLGIHTATNTTGNQLTISQNKIYGLINTSINSTAEVTGIRVAGFVHTSTISKNLIHSLSSSTTTSIAPFPSVAGIHLAEGISVVSNNMIRLGIDSSGSSIMNSVNFKGIWNASNQAGKILFNTVYIGGTHSAAGKALTAAYEHSSLSNTVDIIRDNIFINARSNSNVAARTNHAVVTLANLTMTYNNNLYYVDGAGTAFGLNGTDTLATFANWRTVYPARDAQSFFGDANLANPTGNAQQVNLHLKAPSPAEAAGAALPEVTDDFDGDIRTNTTPTDIGADAGNYGFASTDVGVTKLVSPDSIGCTTSAQAIVVSLRNYSNSAIDFATNNITVTVNVSGGSQYSGFKILDVGTLNSGDSLLVTMPTPINLMSNGVYRFTAFSTVNSGPSDSNLQNDSMPPVERRVSRLGGTYTVGVFGHFPTLTAAATAYNVAMCFDSSVVFRLTDANYVSETFPIVFSGNPALGSKKLTIKPAAGNSPTINGYHHITLLDLSGADNVVIDGSNTSGGRSRDLRLINTYRFQHTNYGIGSTIRLWNDASNIMIANCNLESSANSVLAIGTGLVTGNDSIGIYNNLIRDRSDSVGVPSNLIVETGSSGSVKNSNIAISGNTMKNFEMAAIFAQLNSTSENWTITSNDIFQEATRTTNISGIRLRGCHGINLIAMNKIHDLVASGASTTTGIHLMDTRGAIADRNHIYQFHSAPGATGSITGILFSSETSSYGVARISNNMVSIAPTHATNQQIRGIADTGHWLDSLNVCHNSIYIGGSSSGTTPSWALVRATVFTTHISMNNLCFNNRTGGGANHYAAGDRISQPSSYSGNYNMYIGTGPTPSKYMDLSNNINGSPVSVTEWKNATPARDSNSVFSDPGVGNFQLSTIYVSESDLHAVASSPAIGKGTYLPYLVRDFDGQRRIVNSPDIGADELNGLPVAYLFTGNGDWSFAGNWQDAAMPPSEINNGDEIIIDPASGFCTLNMPQSIANGGKLRVKAGKTLIISTSIN
jgi:hypothetical protein